MRSMLPTNKRNFRLCSSSKFNISGAETISFFFKIVGLFFSAQIHTQRNSRYTLLAFHRVLILEYIALIAPGFFINLLVHPWVFGQNCDHNANLCIVRSLIRMFVCGISLF